MLSCLSLPRALLWKQQEFFHSSTHIAKLLHLPQWKSKPLLFPAPHPPQSHPALYETNVFHYLLSCLSLNLCLSTCWTGKRLCLLLILIARSVAGGTFPQTTETTSTALLPSPEVPCFLGDNSPCRTVSVCKEPEIRQKKPSILWSRAIL